MSLRTMRQIVDTLATEVRARPSPTEFELAYQARIAIERMKFAVRLTEKFATPCSSVLEANILLLEAVGRLEEADRHFQSRFRSVITQDSEALQNGFGIQDQTGGPRP